MKALQRWRPLTEADPCGHLRGMRQDQLHGDYLLASDAITEIRYLLDQLAEYGWYDVREGLDA